MLNYLRRRFSPIPAPFPREAEGEIICEVLGPQRNAYEVQLVMGKIIVNRERCKACALCTLACPKKVILFSQEANSHGFYPAELSSETECTGCALCAEVCPDVAIEVWR